MSEGDAADLCVTDPGYDVDLLILADLRTMAAVWTGDVSLQAALASGALEAQGPADLRRHLRAGWASARSPRSRTCGRCPLPSERTALHCHFRQHEWLRAALALTFCWHLPTR